MYSAEMGAIGSGRTGSFAGIYLVRLFFSSLAIEAPVG